MTRRERLEAKIERREGWITKRRQEAAATFQRIEPYTSDHAFNTQPGHIPIRARIIAQEDRAFKSLEKADSMAAKNDGLGQQLDRTIFSDDETAIADLEARIAERETVAERIKALNKAIKREYGAWKKLSETERATATWLDKIGATEAECRRIKDNVEFDWRHEPTFAPYVLTNLRGRITADRERIKAIQARQNKTAKAEAAGGVAVEPIGTDSARVTFAEKPTREVINVLKAAGFYWAGGSWYGKREALPEGVR